MYTWFGRNPLRDVEEIGESLFERAGPAQNQVNLSRGRRLALGCLSRRLRHGVYGAVPRGAATILVLAGSVPLS